MRTITLALAVLTAGIIPAMAADQVATAPPSGAYKQVSSLVKLPDFLPGLGQLFVDPLPCRLVLFWPTTTMASSSARSTWSRSRTSIPTSGSTT